VYGFLSEHYRLSIPYILRLTDRQVFLWYGAPRDKYGQRKPSPTKPRRFYRESREEVMNRFFEMGRALRFNEKTLQEAWSKAQAVYEGREYEPANPVSVPESVGG
jgi:hypothetical protein